MENVADREPPQWAAFLMGARRSFTQRRKEDLAPLRLPFAPLREKFLRLWIR